jgi:hypothetical protein
MNACHLVVFFWNQGAAEIAAGAVQQQLTLLGVGS